MATITGTVLAGAVAPEGITLTISVDGLDMTTVTAVALHAFYPFATTVSATWTGSIAAATSTSLTVTYTFTTGDVPATQTGLWSIVPYLTVPAGTQRAYAVGMLVALEQDRNAG